MISLEEIVDKWLAEHYYDYWVWSIPDAAYTSWPIRFYIISNDEVLLATISQHIITPTTQFKDISPSISVFDPEFFNKLEYFMSKASKRHNARRNRK